MTPNKKIPITYIDGLPYVDLQYIVQFPEMLSAKSIIGRSTTANISGTYNVDMKDLSEHYILTLTGDSIIQFTNIITNAQSVVITMSITGEFALTLPSWLKAMPDNDDYDGTLDNEIVINIKRGGATPIGYYSLTNMI